MEISTLKVRAWAVALAATVLVAAPAARAQAPNAADTCAREVNPDKAIDSCTQAIGSGEFTGSNLAFLFYDRGLAHQAKRDYELAIEDYDRAIDTKPDFAEAFYNRGVSYFRKADNDRAIADLDHSISLDATHGPVFRSRGDAYQSKGENQRAIRDYDEALRLDPTDAEAFSDRGTSYLNEGDDDHAIQDYTRALRLDPKFAVVYTNRGTAYANKGDTARAIRDYDAAIRLNPNLALAYSNRGIVRSNRGDFELALRDFNHAMRLSPALAQPYYNRGRARFERARFAAAAPDFAAAVARAPGELYFSIWLYLARARAGQKPDKVLPDSVSGNRKKPDLMEWPGPIISAYEGKLSVDELLAAAADPDPHTQRTQICETHFYLAELQMISNDRPAAQKEFQLAVALCPKGYDEYSAARAELRRLAPPSPKPSAQSSRSTRPSTVTK